MTKNNSVVAIFKSHIEAETAVKELQQAGFDMKKLSIVGRDYHTDENVVGYYNTEDRMKYWGKLGAFLGRFLGPAVWLRVLFCSRCRPAAIRRTHCRLYRRGAGRRGGGGRFERARCRALQHGHSQGQYSDIRRAKELALKGIHYVDVGTSGGVWGFERGYCMMIGGDSKGRSTT